MELEERKCPLCDRVVQDSSMPDDPCVYFDCECGYVLIAPREKPIADAGGIKCDMAHICRQAQQTIEEMEERERHHRLMKGVTDVKDQTTPATGRIIASDDEKCCKASHKDIVDGAREHYKKVSDIAHEWLSTIETALDFYEKYGELIVEEEKTEYNAVKAAPEPLLRYHRCINCGTVFVPCMYGGGGTACANVNDLAAICILCGSNATRHMSELTLCEHLDNLAKDWLE